MIGIFKSWVLVISVIEIFGSAFVAPFVVLKYMTYELAIKLHSLWNAWRMTYRLEYKFIVKICKAYLYLKQIENKVVQIYVFYKWINFDI